MKMIVQNSKKGERLILRVMIRASQMRRLRRVPKQLPRRKRRPKQLRKQIL